MPSAGDLRNSASALDAAGRRDGPPVVDIGFIRPNQFLDRTGRKFWGADYHNFTEALGGALEKATRGLRSGVSRKTPKDTGALRRASFSFISRGGRAVRRSSGTAIRLSAFQQGRDRRAKLPSYMRETLFREAIFIEAGYQAHKGSMPLYQQMRAIEHGSKTTARHRAVNSIHALMIRRVRYHVRANVNKYLGAIRRADVGGADPRRPTTARGRQRIAKQREKIIDNARRYAATRAKFSSSSTTITKRFPAQIPRSRR